MHAALLFNRRLWTIFMSAAESDDNPQPVEVRQNIMNIALFVMQRTIEMQSNPKPGKDAVADRYQLEHCCGSVGQGVTRRRRRAVVRAAELFTAMTAALQIGT